MGSTAALVGCTSPGSSSDDEPTETTEETTEATGTPTCGTDPVTIKAYFEQGFPIVNALAEEFTAQNPNVTFDITNDDFATLTTNMPRILADGSADIVRVPQLVDLVNDDLLANLDSYATAFGWDQWPAAQLAQMRVDEDGRQGSGTLYAQGLNYNMTGVFYNKELAAQAGITDVPTTLADFDADLQAVKDAGLTPIAQFNGGETGGLVFPLQDLMASYGETSAINDWINQKPGATIDTPSNLQAADHLQRWVEAGFFADDVNAMDYSTMMSRFTEGEAVYIFDGDWESGNLDTAMPGNVGFFLVPPVEEGGSFGTMSAPLMYGISANAENPDCAAVFLDWVATNDAARTIAIEGEGGGSHPMGPIDAFLPDVDPDSVRAATLAAGAALGEVNGAMDFIANATGSIYARGWTPQLQALVAGEQDAGGLLTAVQAEYEAQIGG